MKSASAKVLAGGERRGLSADDLRAMVAAALRHADDPSAPVHTMPGPNSRRGA